MQQQLSQEEFEQQCYELFRGPPGGPASGNMLNISIYWMITSGICTLPFEHEHNMKGQARQYC
jgi:hypothetical protein